MPRVSRSVLKDDKLQDIYEQFSYLISTLSKNTEIENFLNSFLTKEEKVMLAKRLMLFMMLKKGYSVEEIQAGLLVSYETVRSYANQLPMKNEQFQVTIQKLLNRQSAKDFWDKIDEILKPVTLALNAKNNMKARAKFISGDY